MILPMGKVVTGCRYINIEVTENKTTILMWKPQVDRALSSPWILYMHRKITQNIKTLQKHWQGLPTSAATKKPPRKVSVQTYYIGGKCHTWNGPWCWGHRMGPRKWLGFAQPIVENPLPNTPPPGGSIYDGSWWWHNAERLKTYTLQMATYYS